MAERRYSGMAGKQRLYADMKKRSVNRKVKSSPVTVGSPEAGRKARAAYKRPTTARPKPPGPTTIAAAKRAGVKNFYRWENGKWAKKAAVTAGDLRKSGHKTLAAYLRAKGKPKSQLKTNKLKTNKSRMGGVGKLLI